MKYAFNVNMKWSQGDMEAETDQEAIEKLKESFKSEFGCLPYDEEITIVEKI